MVRIKHNNLVIVGSSHIAKESIKEVKKAIEQEKPDIIALELDRNRMHALFEKNEKISFGIYKKVGVKGALFAMLGHWAEHSLGKKIGVKPGAEMKEAIKIAKEKKIKIALIDKKIELILKELSKRISWREKWNFLTDIVKGIFGVGIKFDLEKVPEEKLIKELLEQTKKRYPNIYDVLLTKRNKYMANNIKILMENHKKVVAVVGAGHVHGILEDLKYLNNE